MIMKRRPLGKLSDFVVEKMADEFTATIQKCEKLLGDLSEDNIVGVMDSSERDLACLDAKMLEAFLARHGLPVSPQLVKLVNRLSGDKVPVITYMEVILKNPTNDLRVFTVKGGIGDTEEKFYRTHKVVESHFDFAIEQVKKAIEDLVRGDVDAANEELRLVQSSDHGLLKIVKQLMGLWDMKEGHFDAFRQYFLVTWNDFHSSRRQLKGPSGIFSSTFYILELLLRGDEFSREYPEYIGYLWTNSKFFYDRGRKVLDCATDCANGNTLLSLWRKNGRNAKLLDCISFIGEFYNKFREKHLDVVIKQLPELSSGTAETEPIKFLEERLARTRFHKERYQEELNS